MQTGKRLIAKTLSTRDFTGSLAQNAGAFVSLDVSGLGVGINVDSLLRAVNVVSMEDLDWELWFFRKTGTAGNDANPDTNALSGLVVLSATAVRIAGAGLYTFYTEGLNIHLFDEDRTSKIHMALINRTAGSKTAGAAGAVKVTLVIEPAMGV